MTATEGTPEATNPIDQVGVSGQPRHGEAHDGSDDESTLLDSAIDGVNSAWGLVKSTSSKVPMPRMPPAAERIENARRANDEWLAELDEHRTDEMKLAWCSSCFCEVDHQKVDRPETRLPAYLCSNCGVPTLTCAAVGCDNMALRGRGVIKALRYCAEHRHDIPSFAKANDKMESLGDYRQFLEYEKKNLSRGTKLAGIGITGILLGGPMAAAAAPAIGGAVGTAVGGYTGAAASSYGLALLGGGAVAAGGGGMAAGAMVVTAVGAALGGAMGASVTNAYVREDKSFHIEMLQGGDGVPVVVANGWLSESGTGWGEWKDIITTRYPDSPVYRVHWGAKEIKDLAGLLGMTTVKGVGSAGLRRAALRASKQAAGKLPGLGPLAVTGVAKNPWTVARRRAEKTGVVLADLLARTNVDSYVLVGHSLGARAMVSTAQTMATKQDGPRLEAVHLLGAAIGAKTDCDTLTARVNDAVYNYHSTNDAVLKVYTVARANQKVAGLVGFASHAPKLKNIDVSAAVSGHSDYHADVTLR